MEIILQGLIELSSVFDYFSDLYILYWLSQSVDTSWFTFMLLTMMLPYYTVYSSLMTFKIVDIRKQKLRNKKLNCCDLLKVLILVLPTMLLLMAFMDVFFMIANVIIFAFMCLFLVPFVCCPQYQRKMYELNDYCLNKVFHLFFGMSVMDVRGFKC